LLKLVKEINVNIIDSELQLSLIYVSDSIKQSKSIMKNVL